MPRWKTLPSLYKPAVMTGAALGAGRAAEGEGGAASAAMVVGEGVCVCVCDGGDVRAWRGVCVRA